MRVMAGQTSDSRIVRVPAAAQHQAVALEADGHHAPQAQRMHVLNGAMAGSAKFHRVPWRKVCRVGNEELSKITLFHCRHMPPSGTVTMLAGNARSHLRDVELTVADCSRKMAPEAVGRPFGRHLAPDGLLD